MPLPAKSVITESIIWSNFNIALPPGRSLRRQAQQGWTAGDAVIIDRSCHPPSDPGATQDFVRSRRSGKLRNDVPQIVNSGRVVEDLGCHLRVVGPLTSRSTLSSTSCDPHSMKKVRRFRDFLSDFLRSSPGIREIRQFVAELARVQTNGGDLEMAEFWRIQLRATSLRVSSLVSGPSPGRMLPSGLFHDATCVAVG